MVNISDFMPWLILLIIVIFAGMYMLISVCIGNSSKMTVKSDKVDIELGSDPNGIEPTSQKSKKVQRPSTDVAHSDLTNRD
ncbi:hypothetical protein U732_63 [Clostridium argentinense CDC 2741]|uniref:Uncharacterized protein n=2 Tax=Clostridium argentinense TaxID=29341 RepID=A0A0C1UAD9_9CLOT|nr:hypothetical protein [Clostridium argentinense]ARC83082.1 hypothetical protein RSJ17_00065 [Clostridium argentinense]KIE44515.1 hypothetical protein U732_63 [Clostridium argentinense CDC 2741]NFF41841.1 hypothetical protein [Clostridium argentinense]NFP51739.1 hypothetical protein [Clostridium argentinense]NFP74888.1 hypothetical protein [Clostridium argentinense]